MAALSVTPNVFGTDGIRGAVGTYPLTSEGCLRVGWAVGREVNRRGKNLIIIGRDTRTSSMMLESALLAGCLASGTNALLVGTIPTPAVAYFVQKFQANMGLVVSGSHNPAADNGVKFIACDGRKISPSIEESIQSRLLAPIQDTESTDLGQVVPAVDSYRLYKRYCSAMIGKDFQLSGVHLVLDCAHGACAQIAPQIFEEFGAQVTTIGSCPNGSNIHAGCGSTHPEAISKAVLEQGADLGFAFDGDGDRVIVIDSSGKVCDGDYILYALAKVNHRIGNPVGGVVSTVMANLGFEQSLEKLGIPMERVDVGDRNVQLRLTEKNWWLGGEPSGHIYCHKTSTTGDGIVTALFTLKACQLADANFESLVADMVRLPGKLVSVPVRKPSKFARCEELIQQIESITKGYGSALRFNVRPSGTEPVVRILVEGAEADLVDNKTTEIATLIRECKELH